MPYTYTPLGDDEIRILKYAVNISEDGPTGPIVGTLHNVPLSEKPAFTAISYLWGDHNVTEDIYLDGEPLPVPVNLADGLQHAIFSWGYHFRGRDFGEFTFWADAICINQADIPERNHQVKRMADIYQTAELVISWLGLGDGLTDLGIDTLRLIANECCDLDDEEILSMEWIEKHPSLCDDTWLKPLPSSHTADDSEAGHDAQDEVSDQGGLAPDSLFQVFYQEPVTITAPKSGSTEREGQVVVHNSRWYATVWLFQLEYWSRVWVFQETVLAKELIIGTQGRFIYWRSMVKAKTTLYTIKEGFENDRITCPESLMGTSIWRLLSTDAGVLQYEFNID